MCYSKFEILEARFKSALNDLNFSLAIHKAILSKACSYVRSAGLAGTLMKESSKELLILILNKMKILVDEQFINENDWILVMNYLDLHVHLKHSCSSFFQIYLYRWHLKGLLKKLLKNYLIGYRLAKYFVKHSNLFGWKGICSKSILEKSISLLKKGLQKAGKC